MDFSWRYVLVGFFFSNGWPHYIAGLAGKRFRSPLGPDSSARLNLIWGIANFVLGTVVLVWNGLNPEWQAFLIGYWLIVAMFGFGIRHFTGKDF
jgi:uncharacterized membrane protein HdeD (DUF308 family)